MTSNKTIEERLEAAILDALQRYPDMHPKAKEHFLNYLLTGESDATHFHDFPDHTGPYRWLVSVNTVLYRPSYLDDYIRKSGYKETTTDD